MRRADEHPFDGPPPDGRRTARPVGTGPTRRSHGTLRADPVHRAGRERQDDDTGGSGRLADRDRVHAHCDRFRFERAAGRVCDRCQAQRLQQAGVSQQARSDGGAEPIQVGHRTRGNQERHDFASARSRRVVISGRQGVDHPVQRRRVEPVVARVHGRAIRQQYARYFDMRTERRPVQWRLTGIVCHGYAGAAIDQERHDVGVAVPGGVLQRGVELTGRDRRHAAAPAHRRRRARDRACRLQPLQQDSAARRDPRKTGPRPAVRSRDNRARCRGRFRPARLRSVRRAPAAFRATRSARPPVRDGCSSPPGRAPSIRRRKRPRRRSHPLRHRAAAASKRRCSLA